MKTHSSFRSTKIKMMEEGEVKQEDRETKWRKGFKAKTSNAVRQVFCLFKLVSDLSSSFDQKLISVTNALGWWQEVERHIDVLSWGKMADSSGLVSPDWPCGWLWRSIDVQQVCRQQGCQFKSSWTNESVDAFDVKTSIKQTRYKTCVSRNKLTVDPLTF